MQPSQEKKWTRDLIRESAKCLQQYQADIAFLQNKLEDLRKALNAKTTPLLQRAVTSLRQSLSYEDLVILELHVKTKLIEKYPIFSNLPLFEEKLGTLRRLAQAEEKKLTTTQDLLKQEKSFGLYKLDDLCKNYQTHLLRKLGAKADTSIEKAFKEALQNPLLRHKAQLYYDKFMEIDKLRGLLSVDPKHQLNNKLSPGKRRLAFEKEFNEQRELYSTHSNQPLLFKDSETGLKFLEGVKKIANPLEARRKIAGKTL
jgi:hypothetical protein